MSRRPTAELLTRTCLLFAFATFSACGGDTTESDGGGGAATEMPDLPTLPDDADPDIARFEDFAAATFTTPTTVDNPFLPLVPGSRVVLAGTTVDEGEELEHQIRLVVTDLTKEILGVETVVVWIEDYSDDELVEVEVAFYAQDDAGNVWFFGEHPEEYEDEELIDAPTWIAGVDGAYPGIAMYADPRPGGPAYFQGWGPEVGWSDFAVVESAGDEICFEIGCFADAIVIAESSLDEAGIAQLKSHAPGVGTIGVDFRGDDETQEQLEVVDHGRVSATDLATFNALARTLEVNAYVVSPDVYGTTKPMR